VIGLDGPWGCGKTSIKNLVLEELGRTETNKIQIIDFNPWQWAGQDQLGQAFFSQIGANLKKSFETSKWKKLSKKWMLYAAYLGIGAQVSGVAQQLVPFLLGVSLLLAMSPSVIDNEFIRSTSYLLSFVAVAIATVLSWSQKVAEKLASVFEAKATYEAKSLKEIKSEISEELRNIDRSLLVVVDDLDRLTGDEVSLVFQLVKANADFPNVVYLLLFERGLIEKHLDSISGGSGRDFLEKIIQVSFDVPMVDQRKIWKALNEGFNKILANPPATEHFDSTRYTTIFIGQLRDYFENLRDVNRFLASISFDVGSFMNGGVFEVNPIDLIGIEVLRVFEPEVYHRLPGAKSLLTSSAARTSLLGIKDEDAKSILHSLLESVPESRRQRVESLIRELFPPSDRYFEGGTEYASSQWQQWDQDLRVCTEYCFDRYFQLALLEDQISERELKNVLAIVGDRDSLLKQLRDYGRNDRLLALIERLSIYGGKVPKDATVPLITALFDISDELSGEEESMFNVTASQYINSIVFSQLGLERDPKRRAELLKTALEKTIGVTAPISYLSIESAKAGKKDVEEENTVEDASLLHQLQNLVVQKIERKAKEGTLGKLRKLRSALAAWRDWGSVEAAKQWVQGFVKSSEGASQFFAAFLLETRSYSSGHAPTKTFWMSLKSIEAYVQPEYLESQVGSINQQLLTDEQKLALSTFQKALRRKRDGKPDADWELDE
jgi:predicted KAP-like P-loop ATPase